MENDFSPQQSLEIIQSMIQKTRTSIGGSRFYFLFWGWFVFLAFVIEFILKVIVHYEHHYIVWWGVLPAVLITILYSRKLGKQRPVRTYIGDSMSYLWTGVGISFFVLSFIVSNIGAEGQYQGYPFFIMLYGLGTFVSGRILQFKPLVVGGIINWVLAGVSVLVPYDYQLLIAAAAVLISYIIPGHLLATDKN